MEIAREKITGEMEVPEEILKEVKNISDFKKKVEGSLTAKATELLAVILGGAMALNASDIHIEPEEKEVKLRIRLDGVLHDVLTFDSKIYQTLLSRIKLLQD